MNGGIRVNKAEEFLELGKKESDSYRAARIFSAVIRLEPNNVEALFLRGDSWLRFGEYNCEKYAAKDFVKVIDLDPTNTMAYFKLGEALCEFYTDEAYKEAIKNYSKAIELDPTNANFYFRRGSISAPAEAIADFTRAIELDPTNSYAYSERGAIYETLKNFDAAQKDFEKTIRLALNEGNKKIRYFKYRFFRNFCKRTGKFDEELAVIPDNAMIFFAREIHLSWEKNFQAAAKDFLKAIDCDPTEVKFYFELGETYRELKNYSAAIESYSKSLELDPDNYNIYSARAGCYQKLGDLTKASEDSFSGRFLEITKKFEHEPTAENYYMRGFNCKLQRRYAEAIVNFTRAIELDPDNFTAYYLRGVCLKKLDEEEKAQADFDKHRELVRIYEIKDEIEKFSYLIKHEPYDFANYSSRAAQYLRLQDYEKALADIDTAIELAPNDAELYKWREQISIRQKGFEAT